MAKVIIDDTNLKNIANTLREKLGTEDTLKVSEFADKINEAYDTKPMFDKNWTDWSFVFAGTGRPEVYNSLEYDSTANGTDFSYMFYKAAYTSDNAQYGSRVIKVPVKQFNTSNGKYFSYMFAEPVQWESNYTRIWTLYDTSNAKKVDHMFYKNGMLHELPNFNFLKVTDASSFAAQCENLIKVGNLQIGGKLQSAFSGCKKLVTVSSIDLIGETDISYIFSNCTSLTNLTINTINGTITKANYPFSSCTSLTNLIINGTIDVNNLNITDCKLLSHESLMSVIHALVDKTSDTSGTVWTIKLGSTNLAKLTDDEKLIIENKGWTYA